ncbi:hypothetical protein AB9F45_35330, partial [Rhizobium leguminosarum]
RRTLHDQQSLQHGVHAYGKIAGLTLELTRPFIISLTGADPALTQKIIEGDSRRFGQVVIFVAVDVGRLSCQRFEGMRHGVYDLVFGTLSYKYEAVMQVEFETLA